MANFRFGGPQITTVIKNIIIINVIMVLAQFVLVKLNIDLSDYLGLHYWQSPKFKWWQFVTHMFMHGSPYDLSMTIGHIFFNMYGLYMIGSILEYEWGAKRFLLFYLICGVGASLCYIGVQSVEYGLFNKAFVHYQENPTFVEYAHFIRNQKLDNNPFFRQVLDFWSKNNDCGNCASTSIKGINEYYSAMVNTGMVGASGAVFGVLFGFGYLFPNAELMIMFIPVPVKAKWFVAGYAAIELFSGVGRFQGDNVAHFAHLGGMLFAFILLKIWGTKNRNDFY